MQSDIATLESAQMLGLLPEEFDKIKEILGRIPNFTELSIFSVMWSEHCSYKNSIKWLKTLPRDGEQLLVEAGEENAGLVDIGDNIGCAFKIESHNHPSAIEPYQGAATGVGGINRDIFTMGARPIAQLNSLRFGDLDDPRTRWIVKGVVKGIGDYGNAFGVPTVGGEVFFDDCFTQNPLVNAMSVGLVKEGKTCSAISYGVGNPVFIVGSRTGKDGIHGATFASGDLSEDSVDDLPAVQVGDPFQEKLLLEASLEVIKTDALIGMQDMGAAGIICSTSEMSAKGESGMIINLDKVPTRQSDMKPFEILLSESQERMLIVAQKGKEQAILDVFEKWDLSCVEIGEVIEEDRLYFHMNGKLVADVPADALVLGGGAPVYDREYSEPEYFAKNKLFSQNDVEDKGDYRKAMEHLASHPNIASKRWVYNQYDSTVGTVNMSTNDPSDASIVNVKLSNKALALSVDCNSRYVQSDPEVGAMIAVSEAARNIACSGGKAIAITNCLNFGNPYNPEVYWQFVHSIKGMGAACRAFNTPVTGGNVSFYNQYGKNDETFPVFPSPVIGMLGLLEDKWASMGLSFQSEGDSIFLIGKLSDDIASSEYLYSYKGVKGSPAPYFSLDEELALHEDIRKVISQKLIKSAHDLSDGGLFISLMESCLKNGFGFDINCPVDFRKDGLLFGEAQGRCLMSVHPIKEAEFLASLNVPVLKLGRVNSGNFVIDGESYGELNDFTGMYKNSLQEHILKH